MGRGRSVRRVVISGCSGGGKSTLLEALRRRGHAVVEEPGRRVVAQEQARSGTALPWIDMGAFARRAFALALDDFAAAPSSGLVFFDRGLIDAAAALLHHAGEALPECLSRTNRYDDRVFLTPPWPEIHIADDARRHGLGEAVAEYERLAALYPALGYETLILPKTDVETRADFVLRRLRSIEPQLESFGAPGLRRRRTTMSILTISMPSGASGRLSSRIVPSGMSIIWLSSSMKK